MTYDHMKNRDVIHNIEPYLGLFGFENIKNVRDIDARHLKKRYHKLCLKFHPDKMNSHTSSKLSNEKKEVDFIELQKAYNTLKKINENAHCVVDDFDTHVNEEKSYTDFGWFYQDTKTYYDTIQYYMNVLIKKVIESYDDYSHNKQCDVDHEDKSNTSDNIFTLNITLDNLFNKDVYKYSDDHYIPLWFKSISLDHIQEFMESISENIDYCPNRKSYTDIMFKMKVIHTKYQHDNSDIDISDSNVYLPHKVDILENNDIICYVKNLDLIQWKNKELRIKLCNQRSISFLVNPFVIEKEFVVIFNQGIPRINPKNIYDTSELSNIIVAFI